MGATYLLKVGGGSGKGQHSQAWAQLQQSPAWPSLGTALVLGHRWHHWAGAKLLSNKKKKHQKRRFQPWVEPLLTSPGFVNPACSSWLFPSGCRHRCAHQQHTPEEGAQTKSISILSVIVWISLCKGYFPSLYLNLLSAYFLMPLLLLVLFQEGSMGPGCLGPLGQQAQDKWDWDLWGLNAWVPWDSRFGNSKPGICDFTTQA